MGGRGRLKRCGWAWLVGCEEVWVGVEGWVGEEGWVGVGGLVGGWVDVSLVGGWV